MKMIFMVDADNNLSTGLNGIDMLTEEDTVLIFHNKDLAMTKIKKRVAESQAQIQYIESVKDGKNSIDFQIIAELGVLIGRNEVEFAYIISQDKGYLASIAALKKHHSGTFREVDLRDSIEDCLNLAFMLKAKTKQELSTALVKEYGAIHGNMIYNHIKDLFSQPTASKSRGTSKSTKNNVRKPGKNGVKSTVATTPAPAPAPAPGHAPIPISM